MDNNWQDELKQALSNQHPSPWSERHDFSAAAAQLFPTVITAQMLGQVQTSAVTDPVLAQFLPTDAETIHTAGYHNDPVGDLPATAVPGLIHKYHGRVLLIASGSCAVNCRYCFRRHFPYQQSFAPRNNWGKCIDYLSQDPSIHEVILSGGDPLTLATPVLKQLTKQLATLPHIKTLRIHSRLPVVLPKRIDGEFLQWASSLAMNRVMVLHINHPQELSAAATAAIARLKAHGFTLLNQSVLLKNINDSLPVLSQLSHALFDAGVLPYYLHQMDPVQNAAHFAVELKKAKQLHQQLQAELPGYLTPKLVQEIAGEQHKTPLY